MDSSRCFMGLCAVFDPCFAVHYLEFFLVLQSAWWGKGGGW